MPFGSILGGIGSIAGGIAGSSAANKASNQEQASLLQANQFLGQQYQTDQGFLSPYSQTGGQANNQLALMMSNPSQFQAGFTASPGYQYNLNQQQGAIQNSAASKGGLVGGNTLMALQSNASGLANQDYQQYVGNLMSLQNTGLQAGQAQAQLGQNYGDAVSNNLIGIGNAQAAGTVGSTQALYGGITQGLQGIGSGISGGGAGKALGGIL